MDNNLLTSLLSSLEGARGVDATSLKDQWTTLVTTCTDPQTINSALARTAEFIMRLHEVNDGQRLLELEDILLRILFVGLNSRFSYGLEAARHIFNVKAEYYEYNCIDRNLDFPIGRLHPLPKFVPTINEECDVLKPYVTCTAPCVWTRCLVLNSNEQGVTTIKFANQTEITSIRGLFAPLGSRCTDYEWRMALEVGDLMDAQDSKCIWYLSTVMEVREDSGVKEVKISFRYFDQRGDKKDEQGCYFGWGSSWDQVLNVTSPRIQVPNKMRKNLDYFSSTTSNEPTIDDSYDMVYEEDYKTSPFYAMLRTNFCKSQTLVSLFDVFVKHNGFRILNEMIVNNESPDMVYNLLCLVSMMFFMVPRMAVLQLFTPIVTNLKNWVLGSSKIMNIRLLEMVFASLNLFAKRLMTITEANDFIYDIKKELLLIFLPMNLDKQLIAIKLLYDLIKPGVPFTPEKKAQFLDYINHNGIFYKLYQQNNTHDQVMSRTGEFLKFSIDNNVITSKELDYLWRVVPVSDFRGRAVLEKLLGDVSPEMHHEQVEYLLAKILQIKENQLTLGNLGLLKVLKNKIYSKTSIMRMLDYLWDIITVKSTTIKSSIQVEAELVFRGFISSLGDHQLRFHLLKNMAKRLRETLFIQKEISIFSDYLKTFKDGRSSDDSVEIPVTINEVVGYLKESEGIYQTVLSLVESTKNAEDAKNMVQLLSYLLSRDSSSNSGEILRNLYLKLEDKELVLDVAKEFASSSISFSEWLFSQLPLIDSLSKLTPRGFEAIKELFIEYNVHHKGIRVLFGKPAEFKDVKEKSRKRFLYITLEPFDLLGMQFLEKLLKQLEDEVTVTKLVEFIVSLIVNLDQNIFEKTIEIRNTFLSNIVLDLQNLSKQPFSDRIKGEITKDIKIVKELMICTERRGLFDLVPHIETLEGDYYNLKITNNLTNTKAPKEINVVINQNATFWRLVELVAKLTDEPPLGISVYKSNSTFTLGKNQNGATLASMPIWKDDSLSVQRAEVEEVPRASLLNTGGNDVSSEFQKILLEWFDSYKEGELLTFQGLHKFSNDFSRQPVDQNKTLEVMTKYDLDSDSCLNFAEFRKHFFERTVQSLDGMWKFLNLNRYVNTLKKSTEEPKTLTIEALPRKILGNVYVFSVLFDILRLPSFSPVHSSVYNLIVSLPTNDRIQKALENDFKILDNSSTSFELNYVLDILLKNLRLLQNEFFVFGVNGGIRFLLKKVEEILKGRENSEPLTESAHQILQKIMKAVNIYLFVDLSENNTLFTLFTQRSLQLNLAEFSTLISENLKTCPEEYTTVRKNFREMRVEVDYPQIIQTTNQILVEVIDGTGKKEFNRHLAHQLFKQISTSCLQGNVELKILFSGLLCDSFLVRRLVSQSLYLFATHSHSGRQQIVLYLLNHIPVENTYLCTQYFQLLSLLIEKHIDTINTSFDLAGMVDSILTRVLSMKSEEKRNVAVSENKVLKGQLAVVKAIFQKRPEVCSKMGHYTVPLMKRCLFFYNPVERVEALTVSKECLKKNTQEEFFEDYPKCKSASNRKELLQIVALLQKASPFADFVSSLILPLLEHFPSKIRKPSLKSLAVGLYNFGSTCYMNSMLQMLNVIKPFRNGLLMADSPSAKSQQQMQRLYSYLFFSERQDFVPEKILTSFNPPINPMIQQDTTEFLNFLFNHLEEDIKPTPYKKLLDCLFQGTTAVQMICHSCGKKKERDEFFFCYQVGVKDRNHLSEALQHNHEGEVINDWQCEFCNKKSAITKRSLLKDIPNIMFIHLQRIVFNFDVYVNTKIHTRLEFPTQLNIEPYTKEGVELREAVGLEYLKRLAENQEERRSFEEKCRHGQGKENYLMELVGVIVHSGTADVGHYYSFVKQERSEETGEKKEGGGVEKPKDLVSSVKSEYNWLKLDDSSASFATSSTMFSECFGGTMQGDWGFAGSEQSKNAYVLVYEKKVKRPIEVDFTRDSLNELVKFETKPASNQVQYKEFKTYNLQKYYKEVWLDNHHLMLETHLIGQDNGKSFLKFLEDTLEVSQEKDRAEVVSQAMFKIIPHVGEAGSIMEIFEKTEPGFEVFSKYLGDQKRVLEMLFHNDKATREAFGKYVAVVILGCLQLQDKEKNQIIYAFLANLLSLLNTEVAKNWIKSESFFFVFYKLLTESANSSDLYFFLVSKELIAQYVDFILEKDSPLNLAIKKHQIGNKHANIDFTYAVQTILFLLKRSFLFIDKNVEVQLIPQHQKFHLSDNQSIALSTMDLYQKLIWGKQSVRDVSNILHRLSIQNLAFSKAIIRLLLTILTECKGNDVSFGVIECLYQLMIIQDNFSYNRAEMLLGCGMQQQVKSDNRIYSLEEEIFMFVSPLEDLFPVEPLLYYCYSNRTIFPLLVLQLLHLVTGCCAATQTLTEFLVRQRAVTYQHLRYYHWVRKYALEVKSLVSLTKENAEHVDTQIQDILKYCSTLDRYVEEQKINLDSLIAGAVIEQRVQYKVNVQDQVNIFQELTEFEVYGVGLSPLESPLDNSTLSEALEGSKLKDKNIDPNSNVLYIMKPSSTPTIPKKSQKIEKTWAIEEETNIQPFFSDVEDVRMQTEETKEQVVERQEKKEEEHKEQKSKDMQEQNSQPVLINIDGIVSCTYLRQLTIENASDTDVCVEVEFLELDPLKTNCVLPSKCSVKIRSGYKETVLVMTKYDPAKPWYQFPFRVKVEDGDKFNRQKQNQIHCYRLYGEVPPACFESKISKAQFQISSPSPTPQSGIEEELKQPDLSSAQPLDLKCPICTFLNVPFLSQCEMCGTALM